MSRRILPPDIDDRTATELFRALREMAPHYTKEWSAKDDDDPGVALLKIYSFIAEGVISRLNRAPERNFLAFLDLLGIRLLQARAARVPVRFLVATGIEDPFIVDQGTQVSAPPTEQRTEDLPFETLTKLLAIPSNLTALVAVDPEADRIFQPPPGFLQLEKAATPAPALTVQAFSSVNSNTLQLDPPDQVKKGDFLRIDRRVIERTGPEQCVPITNNKESTESEHLVVADVKGTVVTLTDLLKQDYMEGTTVRKVTQFELFEAKNWQEHILYLAHKEYFAVRSEAQIIIRVQHAPGVSSNLQSFKVVWEFFGKLEALKDEPEKWQQFEVDADATQGLTRDGEVLLTKPAGEITETEIDGKKTRWIRARLDQPLPATSLIPVPKIELINFAVSSGGKNLPPDKAFHNDTPLTTDVEFLPFGTEPRIFDRFSIASEEAFSKSGAEVVLDVQLDFTDLLASPVAIFKNKKIRAFAYGATGKLIEFQLDSVTSGFDTISHRTPTDRRLVGGTVPSVVANAAGNTLAVFVRVDDGRIHLRHIPDVGQSSWIDLENRNLAGEITFDPAAVLFNGKWRVYVVADNRVHFREVDPASANTPSDWAEVTSGVGNSKPSAASTPFPIAVQSGPNLKVWVVVTDNSDHTWFHDGTDWHDTGPALSFLAAKNARPYAVLTPDPNPTDLRIFVRGAQGSVVEFDVNPNTASFTATDLGSPDTNVLVQSNVCAIATPTGARIFVRGNDDQLWERDLTLAPWKQHHNAVDAQLAGDPFAIKYNPVGAGQDDLLSVLSTSNKNLLLEFRSAKEVENGPLSAGPKKIILLDDPITDVNTHFIRITSGPGAGSDDDHVRKIVDHEDTFAILDNELDEAPTADSRYEFFRQLEQGSVVQAAGNLDVELQSGTAATTDKFVFVKSPPMTAAPTPGQIRRITSVTPGATGDTATIANAWDDNPKAGDDYFVLEQLTPTRKVSEGSARHVVLTGPANLPPTDYPGLFVEITEVGKPVLTGKIAEYLAGIRGVVFQADLAHAPGETAFYKITVGQIAEGWQSYQDPNQTELRPELSWEYWNGKGFVQLPVNDSTDKFLVPGKVIFTIPQDIQKTEVAGQESYWIRARIVGGDYGRELFTFDQTTGQVKIEKDPIRPPRILELGISYKVTELKNPQFCLALNNLNYLDQTAANFTPNKNFQPFLPLSDDNKALYFGFDRSFSGAPVKIYFAAKELPVDERNKPKLAWSFAYENDWKEILVDDETEAFTSPDFVTMNVPDGFQDSQKFGQGLYWIRATLAEGQWSSSPLFSGVFLNTVEARQVRTIRDEIIGSSTSLKNQKFKFQQTPIIEGEVVRVREALTEEERKQLVLARGEDAVLEIRDQQDRVLQTWIRWIEVPEFFDSDGTSRHYRLDRHTGEIEFGDGVHGRIPPAGGDNIVAFTYQAGGGLAGNVKAGEINTPVTAVAGIDSVINPVAAGGGSDAVTNDDMLTIGPAQISHRERAVTPDDFEKLALEASREVRKARCRPNRNANGMHELGWTTVHIVPDSLDATPVPSLGLRRAVQRYLAERADVTVVDQKHIFIGPPEYVPVTVEATIFAKSLDVVASAEQKVKKELETFLHPLRGGPEKEGWEFGRDLAASDLYAVLEAIDEVDYVSSLQLFSGNVSSGEQVAVAPDALIASGTHRITTTVSTE